MMKKKEIKNLLKIIKKKYSVDIESQFFSEKSKNCDKCQDCSDWDPNGDCKNGWDK